MAIQQSVAFWPIGLLCLLDESSWRVQIVLSIMVRCSEYVVGSRVYDMGLISICGLLISVGKRDWW